MESGEFERFINVLLRRIGAAKINIRACKIFLSSIKCSRVENVFEGICNVCFIKSGTSSSSSSDSLSSLPKVNIKCSKLTKN